MNCDDAPKLLKDFLFYLDVVSGKSKKTIYEYYLDLRFYLKFIKFTKYHLSFEIEDININDIDENFLKTVTLQETYEYLFHMKQVKGCNNSTLNRKSCAIRMFFKYLCNKIEVLEKNPVENLESTSLPKTLPKHLSIEECQKLINSTSDGTNKRRDYAIIVLFLNCGMRLSELVNINLSDLGNDYVTITGKGNKQRSIFLNETCKNAINDYLQNERPYDGLHNEARDALLISRNKRRMCNRSVQLVIEKHLEKAGLGDKKYSTHKLRHTAATLMHKYGNVDIRVLQEILGHENLGTTQIYTHIDSEEIKTAIGANPVANLHIQKEQEN